VLGGGPAAIAAAFELSDPQLGGRFEVTVHQQGWRLGGKCASGRNAAERDRIEEHGLHVWFGFYDNAFRMIRTALGELKRPPEHPLATFEQTFEPCDRLVLHDRQGPRWHEFPVTFPRNELVPGADTALPELWDVADRLCAWAARQWRPAAGPGSALRTKLMLRAARRLAADGVLSQRILLGEDVGDRDGTRLTTRARLRLLAFALTRLRDRMWDSALADRCAEDPGARLFFTTFDTFASAIAGIVADGVIDRGWAAVDHLDLCEWLGRHGAKEVTLGATPAQRAPVLRAVYDLAFAYPGGNRASADAAAGTAMRNLLRLLFAYRGSVLYRMAAGMGDSVIAPMYELLRRRGVRFNYFSSVSDLRLSPDGGALDAIEIVRQVELRSDAYDPLIDVRGLSCWPSQPRWEQLHDGERLARAGVDFEREANPLGGSSGTLERGRDFDEVVLGIPVAALPPITSEIAARHPRFAGMLASAATVATQSVQLWLTRRPSELGWKHGANSVSGGRDEPLDTWCDMSYLLPREGWEAQDGVTGLAYFCGVLEDRAGEYAAEADTRAGETASLLVETHLGDLLPAALEGGTTDWSVLADRAGRAGAGRLHAQYWRANTAASERYVLTTAGTVSARLAADESGVRHLLLAGDWTRNGVDGGCVEAAVASGMQAARVLIDGQRTAPQTRARPRRDFDSRPTSRREGRPDEHTAAGIR
jgi:uncharacterized protein with NAD-binding domain and iron-sulfur cluster